MLLRGKNNSVEISKRFLQLDIRIIEYITVTAYPHLSSVTFEMMKHTSPVKLQ